MLPSISVVIPTRRRPASLLRVLDALAGQKGLDLQRVEVVVVCDGESDPAFEAVQRGWYPMRLRLAKQQQQGPAAARNHGLAISTGQVIVFLDDDVVPASTFLTVHQQAHEHDQRLAAIGPLLPPPGPGTPWGRWEARIATDRDAALERGERNVSPQDFDTGNASVRRVHLVKAFGFDVTFPRGEDVELAFRLRDRGLRFAFLPGARAAHAAERPYRSWVAGAESRGRFEVRLSRDRGHQEVLESVAAEFRLLPPVTRLLGHASIRRPHVAFAIAWAARPAALVSGRLRAPRLADAALGAAFNATRLAGFTAEVGGSRPALALLDAPRGWWPAEATVGPAAPEPKVARC